MARERIARIYRASVPPMDRHIVTTFTSDYLFLFAFLDGWRGYVVAHVAASFAVYKRLRCYEFSYQSRVARDGQRPAEKMM